MRKITLATSAAALCLAGSWTAAQAATVAQWRFEDKNGLPAIAGDFLRSTPAGGGDASAGNIVDVTSDSSGNGNELRTFHSPNVPTSTDGVQRLETSPTYTLTTPGPIIPQTLAPNLLAFDFDAAPGSDPPAPPNAGGDDIYSRDANNVAGPINGLNLAQYTVEGAFRADTLNRFQSVVVKDGNVGGGGGVGAGPLPPFVVKLFDNNTLNIETFDASGAFRAIQSNAPVSSGTWYKFAVVNNGANLQLYLDSGSGYVLQTQQAPIAMGGLWPTNEPWAVGRGWFNGPNDFFDGQIDEIRISDTALRPGQFLFSLVPEPHSCVLLVLGVLSCACRRPNRPTCV
jgi:Concanavalin A-like lectin/glucanases superfamily